jgi:signal transduction histidine kinase
LRAAAFRPVHDLARALRAYTAGDHSVRAPLSGPRELLEIGDCFNELAATIEAQRIAQATFLGGVAHDLRNPLAGLVLAVTSMKARATDQRQIDQLARIERALKSLDRMASDVVDSAVVDTGQMRIVYSRQDLCALVRDAAALFDGASAKHKLVVEVPGDALVIDCDAIGVGRVLVNLISNAIKYSPHGGAVTVSVTSTADEARLDVSDEGIGIGADASAKLFAPFQRLDLSREALPGVGLGLYTARRIVEAHRGSIDVDSSVGRGSTFRVRLPTHAPASAPASR